MSEESHLLEDNYKLIEYTVAKEIMSFYPTEDNKSFSEFIIKRTGDKCKFKYIVLNNIISQNIDIINLYNELINGTLTLKIGSEIIYVLNYSFLMNLNKPEVINNNIIIKIPDYFFNEIYLISLQYSDVKVFSDTKNENIVNKKMIIEIIYVNKKERDNLTKCAQNIFYQEINQKKFVLKIESIPWLK